MIKRDLLYYSTRAKADTLKFSASASNNSYTIGPAGTSVVSGEPLIGWQTAVFIGDTHEIWVRGTVWVCGSNAAWDIATQSGDSVQEALDKLADAQEKLTEIFGGVQKLQPIEEDEYLTLTNDETDFTQVENGTLLLIYENDSI